MIEVACEALGARGAPDACKEPALPPAALPLSAPAPRPPAPALPLVDWLGPALELPLIELSVDVTIRRRIALSSPACTVVRGLLGKRLRELRCVTAAATCGGCTEAARCDYAQVFEGASPHPFWFQGIPASPAIEVGERHTARLYLAAPAHAIAPYLEVALRNALRALDPEAVLSPTRRRSAPLAQLAPLAPPDGPVHLRAETPLCLRGDGAVCHQLCPRAPWLALLARAGVRRLDALVRAFALPAGARSPRAELPQLANLDLLSGGLTAWASSRFSHRQDRRIPLRGLAGGAIVQGEAIQALVPLLRALTVTGVGKATSLGFGALRMAPGGPSERVRTEAP